MLLTGEPIAAEEALRIGFYAALVPQAELLAAAREMAARIAGFSPVAVQAVKASVRMSIQVPLTADHAYENEMNVLCFSASDHLEGIRAFHEKRDASFAR